MGFCKAYKNKRGYGFDQNVKFESIDSNDCIAYVCESNEILVDVDNPNAVKYFEAVLDYYNIPDSMKHRSKSGGMHYLFTIPHGLKIPFKSRTKACLFIGHFDDVTQKHSGVDIKCGNSALSHVRADDIGFYAPFEGKLYDIPWVLLPATKFEDEYEYHSFTEEYDGKHTERFMKMNRYFDEAHKDYYDELIRVLGYLYSRNDTAVRKYTKPDDRLFVGHWLFGNDKNTTISEKMERYQLHENGMLYDVEEGKFIYPAYGKTSFERVFGLDATKENKFKLRELEPKTVKRFDEATGTREYIVKDLITYGSLNMIYGYAGKGKTYASIYLADKFIDGGEILGREVTKSDVVFIAWESAHITFDRLKKLGIERDVDLLCAENRMHNDHFDKFFNNCDGKVVILDNFGEFAPMDNQSENKFVLISYLSELAKYCNEHNITLFVIAHSPKQQAGATVKPSLANLGGWAEMASRLDTAIEVIDNDVCVLTKARDNIGDNLMLKPFGMISGREIEETKKDKASNEVNVILEGFYNGIELKGLTVEQRKMLIADGYTVFKVGKKFVAVDEDYQPPFNSLDQFNKEVISKLQTEDKLGVYYLLNKMVKGVDYNIDTNGRLLL